MPQAYVWMEQGKALVKAQIPGEEKGIISFNLTCAWNISSVLIFMVKCVLHFV